MRNEFKLFKTKDEKKDDKFISEKKNKLEESKLKEMSSFEIYCRYGKR